MCSKVMKDNSWLGQSGRCGTGEKGESEFLNGFDVGCKRKRQVKCNFKIFGLSN